MNDASCAVLIASREILHSFKIHEVTQENVAIEACIYRSCYSFRCIATVNTHPVSFTVFLVRLGLKA